MYDRCKQPKNKNMLLQNTYSEPKETLASQLSTAYYIYRKTWLSRFLFLEIYAFFFITLQ